MKTKMTMMFTINELCSSSSTRSRFGSENIEFIELKYPINLLIFERNEVDFSRAGNVFERSRNRMPLLLCMLPLSGMSIEGKGLLGVLPLASRRTTARLT